MGQVWTTPLTIEEQLECYVKSEKHSERHETLWHAWNQNKRWIKLLLEGAISSFPTYSKHDESHAQTVLHNIEMILGEDRIARLSATDCFMILHTVYLHDIGMVITSAERKEIVTNDDFIKMIDFLEMEGDKNLRKSVRALKKERYEYEEEDTFEKNKSLYKDKLDVYYALVHLIANYRRSEHGKKSRGRLYDWTMDRDKLSIGFSLSGIPQRIFLTIAECAGLHTEPDFEMIMNLPQEDDGYIFDYIHPRFVSVLLQLGDILDMDNDRFHPLAMLGTDNIPEISEIHYRKHLAIRKLHICPNIIEISADCETQDALRMVRRECDMLISILQQASYMWPDICPKGFPGALPTVGVVDLYLKGRRIPKELVSTKFVIPQKKAFEILEGANLYASRFAFLREFLQNAIDATKMEYWTECKSVAGFQPDMKSILVNSQTPEDLECYVATDRFPIEIKMQIYKRDKEYRHIPVRVEDIENLKRGNRDESTYGVNVWIKDYGIGISQESLKRISMVGTGIDKNKKAIREMPAWLRPTSEFGVGLQSAFVVAPTFKCITRTRSEERYEITFGSGALAQYEGYINVRPISEYENTSDSYGTCFEIFVANNKKMRHEEFPDSWDGADYFDENYECLRPIRHAAEMMSQMILYLDSLLGESIFPIQFRLVETPGIVVPVNTMKRNKLHSIRLYE